MRIIAIAFLLLTAACAKPKPCPVCPSCPTCAPCLPCPPVTQRRGG